MNLNDENNINIMMLDPETEPQIEVDLSTRTITVPEILKDIAVTYDNNAETVYIRVNDSFDGIPLDDKNVFIWFQNARKEVYSTKISEIRHEEEYLILGWTIDDRLTRYPGIVKFQLQFTANLYKLNTLPAELNVLNGLDYYSEAPELPDNLYEQIINRISDLEISYNDILSRLSSLEMKSDNFEKNINTHTDEIEQIKRDIEYIKNNVVYIPSAY